VVIDVPNSLELIELSSKKEIKPDEEEIEPDDEEIKLEEGQEEHES